MTVLEFPLSKNSSIRQTTSLNDFRLPVKDQGRYRDRNLDLPVSCGFDCISGLNRSLSLINVMVLNFYMCFPDLSSQQVQLI